MDIKANDFSIATHHQKTILKGVISMCKHIGSDFIENHKEELESFLRDAKQHGYGSKNSRRDTEMYDGGTEIIYLAGDCDIDGTPEWRYVDKYYGGEPFSGMTTVFYKGVACWSMVYWGEVMSGVDKRQVYDCLMPALMAEDSFHPRGRDGFLSDNELLYYRKGRGDHVVRLYGSEEIYSALGKLIYCAEYTGGIINIS